jgi:hypothetical protein
MDMHCDSCEAKYSSRKHTPGDNCPKCKGGAIRYDDDAEKNMHPRSGHPPSRPQDGFKRYAGSWPKRVP